LDSIERKEEQIANKEKRIEETQAQIDLIYKNQVAELERISNLTMEEARQIILTNVEQEVRHETAQMIKEIERKPGKRPIRKPRILSRLPFSAVPPTMWRKRPFRSSRCPTRR